MMLERPEIINKVHKVLKEYSAKFSAFLVDMETLSVAAQALPFQPLSKHPKHFSPFEKSLTLSHFVYKLIEPSTLSNFSFHVIW